MRKEASDVRKEMDALIYMQLLGGAPAPYDAVNYGVDISVIDLIVSHLGFTPSEVEDAYLHVIAAVDGEHENAH